MTTWLCDKMTVWQDGRQCVTAFLYGKLSVLQIDQYDCVWQGQGVTIWLFVTRARCDNMTVCDKCRMWLQWQGQGVTIWQCVTTWLCVTRARCENKTVCDNMTVCDKGSVWQVSVITLILIDAAAWAGETGGYFPRPAPWEPSLPTHDTGPLCAIKMQLKNRRSNIHQ